MNKSISGPSTSTDHPGYERSSRLTKRTYGPSLLNNRIKIDSNTDEVELGPGFDWTGIESNPTAVFRLNSLTFLYALCDLYRESNDVAYVDAVNRVVDWWIDSKRVPDGTAAWHGHASALRASVLCYLYSAGFLDSSRVFDVILEHGQWLAQDINYEGHWNHGLDQIIALVHCFHVTKSVELGDIAVQRLKAASEAYVDDEGVVSEQATHYAVYVYERLDLAARSFESAGLPIPSTLDRRHLIPEFVRWSTRPDGVLEPIGDTQLELAPVLPVASGNESAKVTALNVAPLGSRIYSAGWVFLRHRTRNGEGLGSSVASMTGRFGYYRQIHGHRDHTSLTWFSNGKNILSDPGFGGYSDPSRRHFERLENSHNTVTLSGAGEFLWENGTVLRSHSTFFVGERGVTLYCFVFDGMPYSGVRRLRSCAFVPDWGFLLVRDSIRSAERVVARQHWQLGEGFSPSSLVGGPRSQFLNDELTLDIRNHLPLSGVEVLSGSVNPVGGWVTGHLGARTEAPSVKYRLASSNPTFLTSLSLNSVADFSWNGGLSPEIANRVTGERIELNSSMFGGFQYLGSSTLSTRFDSR